MHMRQQSHGKYMKRNEKITVIMGVYNPRQPEYLLQAVQSIIGQTFQDWAMLIYDAGSDKEYIPVIRKAAELDPRIRLIRCEKNHGLAYALNQCIKQAKGQYIARMDDDDISKPERLEKIYDFLETHREYQWAGSNSDLIDEKGVWGEGNMQEIPGKEDYLPYSPYIHPSVVFRKKILDRLKGYKVASDTMRCEDYELFMRLYENGYRGYNLQESLFQYREDDNAYKKRKYCYRIREMKIRYQGFKRMGILSIRTLPYVVKPLAVGLVSPRILKYFRKSGKREAYVQRS